MFEQLLLDQLVSSLVMEHRSLRRLVLEFELSCDGHQGVGWHSLPVSQVVVSVTISSAPSQSSCQEGHLLHLLKSLYSFNKCLSGLY